MKRSNKNTQTRDLIWSTIGVHVAIFFFVSSSSSSWVVIEIWNTKSQFTAHNFIRITERGAETYLEFWEKFQIMSGGVATFIMIHHSIELSLMVARLEVITFLYGIDRVRQNSWSNHSPSSLTWTACIFLPATFGEFERCKNQSSDIATAWRYSGNRW